MVWLMGGGGVLYGRCAVGLFHRCAVFYALLVAGLVASALTHCANPHCSQQDEQKFVDAFGLGRHCAPTIFQLAPEAHHSTLDLLPESFW